MASDLDPALIESVAKARYEQDRVYDIDDGYLVPWEDLGDFDQTAFRIDADGWVRAVCPEHHAVYDTRTHVAVPVAEIDDRIKEITESPWWDSADDAGETLYAVRDWLRSLLPKENTDGK